MVSHVISHSRQNQQPPKGSSHQFTNQLGNLDGLSHSCQIPLNHHPTFEVMSLFGDAVASANCLHARPFQPCIVPGLQANNTQRFPRLRQQGPDFHTLHLQEYATWLVSLAPPRLSYYGFHEEEGFALVGFSSLGNFFFSGPATGKTSFNSFA